MTDVTEHVVVVIGSGAMGLAIARRLGSGRTLLIADSNEAGLLSTAELLEAEGHRVTYLGCDVASQAQVRSLASRATELGDVTHLVHTAGVSPAQAAVAKILAVDLLGVAFVLDAFGEVMASGGAGVVITSMAAHLARPGPPGQDQLLANTPADELLDLPFLGADTLVDPNKAYALAKRGNIVRVQAAALAWGARGARVNSVSPGVISTPMGRAELHGDGAQRVAALVGFSPARRVGTADDVAHAACFLLDPSSSFITGTDLLVDGGAVAAARSLTSS